MGNPWSTSLDSTHHPYSEDVKPPLGAFVAFPGMDWNGPTGTISTGTVIRRSKRNATISMLTPRHQRGYVATVRYADILSLPNE